MSTDAFTSEEYSDDVMPGVEPASTGPASISRRAVVLPDFTGRHLHEVLPLAEERAWAVKTTGVRPSDKSQVDGTIVGQEPAPGHHHLEGSVLHLDVVDRSAGKRRSGRATVIFLVAMLLVSLGGFSATLLELRDQQGRLEAADVQLAQMRAEADDYESQLVELSDALDAVEAEKAELEASLEAAEEALSDASAGFTAQLEALHEYIADLEATLSFMDGSAVQLPELAGLTVAEVQALAADGGWTLVVVDADGAVVSDPDPAGLVSFVSPSAGHPVTSGSVVVVFVN